jgi:hypothetical protein
MNVCINDFPDLAAKEIQIPLGCDLVDCCVGCPAGLLDLRVSVSGEAVSGAELRLPGTDGRLLEPRALASGETVVSGVVDSRRSGPAPVATMRLLADRATLDRLRKGAAEEQAGAPIESVSIEIEQLLGEKLVSRAGLVWDLIGCLGLEPCDHIELTGNVDKDQAVILLDARRTAACVDDEITRAIETEPVGNLLDAAGCSAEVSVFSSDNAMAIEEKVDVWTDECGDSLEVDLDPILSADASFFLVVPDKIAEGEWGKPADWVAQSDLLYANAVYDENKTGISFDMHIKKLTILEQLELVWLLPGALLEALLVGGLDPFGVACAIPSQFEAKGYYVPGRLNVYYVALPFAGLTCEDDRNIIFLGLWKKPATLAHEFGHSFSLLGDGGHTNEVAGFTSYNVMWSGGSELRDHFSLGQAFRQNLEPVSTINKNGVRTGLERSCPLTADSEACPPLARDWPRP